MFKSLLARLAAILPPARTPPASEAAAGRVDPLRLAVAADRAALAGMARVAAGSRRLTERRARAAGRSATGIARATSVVL